VTQSPGGGLYLIVGAVVAAILVGDYLMLGTPGLHWPGTVTVVQASDAAPMPRR
jgi:hypothetical protein